MVMAVALAWYPSRGKLISFDRFLIDRPVEPQKRFRDTI